MSKNIEDCCRHSFKCRGCKLYYCADDEIHNCYNCYEHIGLCGSCSGILVGGWNYLCKDCYKSGVSNMCTQCNKEKRITRIPYNEKTAICLRCHKINSSCEIPSVAPL